MYYTKKKRHLQVFFKKDMSQNEKICKKGPSPNENFFKKGPSPNENYLQNLCFPITTVNGLDQIHLFVAVDGLK